MTNNLFCEVIVTFDHQTVDCHHEADGGGLCQIGRDSPKVLLR